MLVFLVLMGVLGGGYHPSAATLISASVKPEKRGRAMGIHMAVGSAPFFLAPLIAVAIAAAWGWRASFIGLAVPTVLFGIIFYVLLGRLADTSKAEPMVTDHHDETSSPPNRLRRLVAFIILSILTHAVSHSVIAFIPLFMVDHFGISEKAAATFLAIYYSTGLWASPLGGYLSDRLGTVSVVLVVCLITGPSIYLLNIVPYAPSIGALLLILGILNYIRTPVSEAYIAGHTPQRHRSTIFGIYYFSGMGAGGLLAPVMGFFIDQFGFYSSFTIASVTIFVVTLICTVFLWGNWD